jgi:hypothetical protein
VGDLHSVRDRSAATDQTLGRVPWILSAGCGSCSLCLIVMISLSRSGLVCGRCCLIVDRGVVAGGLIIGR